MSEPSGLAYVDYLRTLGARARAGHPPGYLAFVRALASKMRGEPAAPRMGRVDYLRRLAALVPRPAPGPPDTAGPEDALEAFRRLIMARPDDLRHRLLGANLSKLRALSPDQRQLLRVLEVEPDLLGPMRRERSETAVSALLAYHLDPGGARVLAPTLLRAFLEAAGAPPEAADADLTTARVRAEAFVPEGRVDVRIETEALLVFVEVKVDADEGDRQLDRYRVALRRQAERLGRRRLLVYLTLDDAPPHEPSDVFTHMTWSTVLKAWLPFAASGGGDAGYLGRYLKSIARLVERAGRGGFADWDLFHQRRALALVTDTEDFA